MSYKSQVYWFDLEPPTLAAPLRGEDNADVVIVGGGMAGLMCAQSLVESGKSVIILERDFCGSGASGKSSGFITPDSELELTDLNENYGPDKAKELWEFVTSGVEAIRKNIEQYNIACDYQVQDSLFVANNLAGYKKAVKEDRVRRELGYDTWLYSKEKLPEILGSQSYSGGVRYKQTYGIISYLYCQGLRNQLLKKGVKIYEQTLATEINSGVVTTTNGKVRAQFIVAAADHWLTQLQVVPAEVYHAQTFLSLSKPLTNEQVKQIFPENNMMVWDTDLIYQYYRITGENRLLLGGASMLYTYAIHERKKTQRIYRKLTRYLKNKFPQVQVEIEYMWPGLIGVSKDFLPVMGECPGIKNVFYVGGAAGLPWAAALGQYVAEKITHNRSEFDEYFRYDRKYLIGRGLQKIITKPITYALSHGAVKYLS